MKQQLDILLCEDDPNLGKLMKEAGVLKKPTSWIV